MGRQERSSPEVPDLPTVEPQAGTERTDALNAALGDLPPRMRAALVYRYFHDLSVAETADALSCSQGTVKSLTARALERLRALMDTTPPAAPPPTTSTTSHPSLSAVTPTPHQEHLMADIRTLLHDAAVLPDTDTLTAEEAADADLVRARRALRRRRAGRTTAASGLLAAAAVGAFVIIGPGQTPSTPPGGATPAAPRSTTSGVQLVAYTGAQPTGYRLDTVPAGWTIRDDTRSLLTLAPKHRDRREHGAGRDQPRGNHRGHDRE